MNKKLFYGFILVFSVFLLFNRTIQADAEQTRENMVITANSGDSSAELQRLLNYNKEGNYKLTVKIPAGDYDLKNELVVFSNTTVLADPNAKFTKNHQKGAMITNDLSNDKGGYTSAENITISGGIWDSANVSRKNKGTESFRFIHATNITVRDATIRNVPENSHLITFAGVKDSLIENCTLYGYLGTKPKEAIQLDIVHDNVIVPSMQASKILYDDLPCDGVKITNCDIYDFPRAIGSHTSIKGVFHKNITITNNNLYDIKEAALKIYNYKDTVISNNKIHNAGVGVLVYTKISNEKNHYLEALKDTVKEPLPTDYNIVIKNNSIFNIVQYKSGSTYSYGEAIRVMGGLQRPLSGVTIENNNLTDTKRYGILMQYSPKSTINNNIIKCTGNSGIYLINGCNFSQITGNELTQTGVAANTPAGGIGLSASTDVVINKNTITSPAKDGIFLYNMSNTCSITANTITSANSNGIAIYSESDETTVAENTIKNYKKRGIFTSRINSITINSNEIYGKYANDEDGIYITDTEADIDNFKLENNYVNTPDRYISYTGNTLKSFLENSTFTNMDKDTISLY